MDDQADNRAVAAAADPTVDSAVVRAYERDRLVWRENERGLHVSISVLGDTYSASGITIQSCLEVLVLELADTLEHHIRATIEASDAGS